jgi:hypothetical protein
MKRLADTTLALLTAAALIGLFGLAAYLFRAGGPLPPIGVYP